MRFYIYKMVTKSQSDDKWTTLYDYFICIVAFLSVVPLMFKTHYAVFTALDTVTVYILFADYVFRWMTADYKMKKGNLSFVIYPITIFALLDFISLLPSLGLIGQGFRVLRMLRIFKIFHYSKSFDYIAHAFVKEKNTLYSVLILALGYIFISALVMFSYEPETFDNFFGALYWATTALTTVGYGDVYPTTDVGRLISMISSLFGIAVIALPAGIITASFVDQIDEEREKEKEEAKKAQNTEETKDEGSYIDKIVERRMEEDKNE